MSDIARFLRSVAERAKRGGTRPDIEPFLPLLADMAETAELSVRAAANNLLRRDHMEALNNDLQRLAAAVAAVEGKGDE